MADTLAVDYDELQFRVARYLGYVSTSSDVASLGTTEASDVDTCVKSGLRSFYRPAIANGSSIHEWSFMQPQTTITTVADTSEYDLPADYAGMVDTPVYTDAGSPYKPLKIIREWALDNMLAKGDSVSAAPVYAAISLKAFTGASAQRFSIKLAPVPDAAYNITFRYAVQGEMLTDSLGYPYGANEHSETIIEACLAAAERDFNEQAGTSHQARFLQLLATSISLDRKASGGWYLGENTDPGVLENSRYGQHFCRPNEEVTVNGNSVVS